VNPEPLTPLVKRSDDSFEHALLRAAQRERAPRGADRRLLAALGVGGGSAASALLAKYAAKLGTKGSFAAIAMAVAAVTAGAFAVSSSHDATEPPVSVEASPPIETPEPPASPNAEARIAEARVEALPSARVEDLPSSPATPARSAGKPVGSTAPSTTSSESAGDLAREVELVRAARALLTRGDSLEAMRTLDVHDREFPSGTLRPESRVLRIEALVRAGGEQNLARANALGDAFLAEQPSGPHARRVRAVLGRDR